MLTSQAIFSSAHGIANNQNNNKDTRISRHGTHFNIDFAQQKVHMKN